MPRPRNPQTPAGETVTVRPYRMTLRLNERERKISIRLASDLSRRGLPVTPADAIRSILIRLDEALAAGHTGISLNG